MTPPELPELREAGAVMSALDTFVRVRDGRTAFVRNLGADLDELAAAVARLRAVVVEDEVPE